MRKTWVYDTSESRGVNIWAAYMYTLSGLGLFTSDEAYKWNLTWGQARQFDKKYGNNKVELLSDEQLSLGV